MQLLYTIGNNISMIYCIKMRFRQFLVAFYNIRVLKLLRSCEIWGMQTGVCPPDVEKGRRTAARVVYI